MSQKKTAPPEGYVKKQTLVGTIVLCLVIGFVSGTIYSSFKLAPVQSGAPANTKGAPQNSSPDLSAKMLQLEQYLQQHPKDAEAWAQMGHLFFDTHQYADAIKAYTRSLEIQPDNPPVITDMGVMYRRNKQPEKAVEAFDRAIQVDPNFETAMFNKGIVLLYDLKDVPAGLAAWEDLLTVNPMAMAPNGESVDALIRQIRDSQ